MARQLSPAVASSFLVSITAALEACASVGVSG
jgi:hypothetical protein